MSANGLYGHIPLDGELVDGNPGEWNHARHVNLIRKCRGPERRCLSEFHYDIGRRGNGYGTRYIYGFLV